MTHQSSPAQDPLRLYSIGLKLRALRNERHLTLACLARETGYSTALLSKLETDRMIPTLPTLARIARIYGIGLSYFFSEPSHHSLSITRQVHIMGMRREVPLPRLTALHIPTADSKQVSEVINLPAGVTSIVAQGGSSTVLTAYVIDGTLRLAINGTEDLLHAGDCVVLDTDAAVLWGATVSPCRVLAVFAE